MSEDRGGGGAPLTASARVPVNGGIDEKTGGVLTARAAAERAGWCAALVQGMATRLLEGHWNPEDMRSLASGRDASGRPLPPWAWVALRRLGWSPTAPEGVRVNDRVCRMAQEQAGRILRSAGWRDALTYAITTTWPVNPGRRTPDEWDAVRAAMPGGEHMPSSVIRARTRQVQRFADDNGRLPDNVFELEAPPQTCAMLLLAACDRQAATIERSAADPGRALLRVQLPSCPDPRSYKDWAWVAVPLVLPPTVPARATLHLPTLRIVRGKLRAEVPFTLLVPAARRSGHDVALSVDWGLNTLLAAGAASLDPDGKVRALGAGAQYRAGGVSAKQHRLRRQNEKLHAKIDHYERLSGDSPDHPLKGKIATLQEEERRVNDRRSHLNNALAWSSARWSVDQAITVGATVIYVEDLRSLEARGMGKTMNTRLAQTVREKIMKRIRHLAAEAGIAVVTVPAPGTSRNCPRCLAVLRHRKAPDRPAEPGWKWARCPDCGWQGDRDTGAWMRIAARGLAHQAKTAVDGTAGTMIIRTVNEHLEVRATIAPYASGRDRSKIGPTTRQKKSRPAPRRRGAPSPVRQQGPVGQRPEGRANTARTPLPRAATRDQGVSTVSGKPAKRVHQARGAALGAGFHLNAHATPARRETGPRRLRPGQARITTLTRDATFRWPRR